MSLPTPSRQACRHASYATSEHKACRRPIRPAASTERDSRALRPQARGDAAHRRESRRRSIPRGRHQGIGGVRINSPASEQIRPRRSKFVPRTKRKRGDATRSSPLIASMRRPHAYITGHPGPSVRIRRRDGYSSSAAVAGVRSMVMLRRGSPLISIAGPLLRPGAGAIPPSL